MHSSIEMSATLSPPCLTSVLAGLEEMKLDAEPNKSTANLLDLPSEIKNIIFENFLEPELIALQLTHRKLAHDARVILYQAPAFASTFRLAQFTHVISQNPDYAVFVHAIDLTCLPQIGRVARLTVYFGRRDEQEREDKAKRVLARREKKIREQIEAYPGTDRLERSVFVTLPIPVPAHAQTTNPRSDPNFTDIPAPWVPSRRLCRDFLMEICAQEQSETPRPAKSDHFYFRLLDEAVDIPIGFLFHILTACTNIQALNINKVKFDTDYQIQSYLRDCHFSRHEWDYLFTFHPTSRDRNLPFCRPQNANNKELDQQEILAIHQQDLMSLIFNLKALRYLGVKNCEWITDEHMAKLLRLGPFKDREQNLRCIEYNGKLGQYLVDLYDEKFKGEKGPTILRQEAANEKDNGIEGDHSETDDFHLGVRR